MSKIEPSVQTLYLATPSVSAGTSGTSYIDLSQIACLVNRRFYRQGINWAVAGFKVLTAEPIGANVLIGEVVIEKLPNTWVMSNSWEKGLRVWNKMNRDALEESPSVRPKFLDFKIYADSEHHSKGFGANLLPANASGFATPGEWEPSKYEIPVATGATEGAVNSRDIIATGANYVAPGASGNFAVSLIEGYAASRGLPNVLDPNTPADALDASGSAAENWMSALFNDGTQQDSEVLADMITENNVAPYPFENDGVHVDTMYPGGANQLSGLQIHDQASYGATTIAGNTRLKGGNFPCGLIKINHAVSAESQAHNIAIIIDLIPGTHRGYLCEPMTEM